MRRRRGCYVCARGGARGSAKRGGGGALVRVARLQKACCCAEQRRFRKDQVTRRDSVARRATFDNWRFAAEQGSQMACQCDQRDLLPRRWCEQPTRITPRSRTHLYFPTAATGPQELPGKPNNPMEPN
jgi:hypothetical protein